MNPDTDRREGMIRMKCIHVIHAVERYNQALTAQADAFARATQIAEVALVILEAALERARRRKR